MNALILFARLLFVQPEPLTTDDVWDCYTASDGSKVCERTLNPCHYEQSPAECTVRVVQYPTKVTKP